MSSVYNPLKDSNYLVTFESKNIVSGNSKDEKYFQKNDVNNIQLSAEKKQRRKSTFPFGECKVCNDKSTGIHYGISTCEGCKVFFKRSINRHYKCSFNNQCEISAKNRNRCKECRFKKCIKVGMSINDIKMGRKPNATWILAIKESSSPPINSFHSNHFVNNVKEPFNLLDASPDKNQKLFDESVTSSQLNLDGLTKFISCINSSPCEDQSQNNILLSNSNRNIDDASFLSIRNSSSYNNISKNIFLIDFIKKQKTSNKSSFSPNAYFSEMFPNIKPLDNSFQLLVSTINDKIYQLYKNSNTKVDEAYERAQYLINNKINIFDGYEITTKEIWNSIIECLPSYVKTFIMFFKEVPGINELNDSDFTIAINTHLFDFYIIQNAHLFINGESYQILFTKTRNIQYSRERMNKIKDKKKNDVLFEFTEEFNKLNLTIKEKALLITLCFTFPEETIKDKETLADLNEFYTRSMLYEFDLNTRNKEFRTRVAQVMSKLKLVRMIYEAD